MSRKPRLLDLFCGAGGAAMGYARAGFEVVGVDIKPQPHYPFEFVEGDALTVGAEMIAAGGWDAIHASPPCQHYSAMRHLPWMRRRETWDSVPPTYALLADVTVPWVIENVVGAPVTDPLLLCGQQFGLRHDDGTPIYRHRLFGANVLLLAPGNHPKRVEKITTPEKNELGHVASGLRRRVLASAGIREISRKGVPGKASKETLARFGGALGIDWMEGVESTQAIPPAYTEWIGRQLLAFDGG